MSKIIHLNKKQFEERASQDKLLIIDFWAEWCGPCKMFSPVFESASETYFEKLDFAKVNADSETELCEKFAIRGIPTLVIIKNGKVIDKKVGAMTKMQFFDYLNAL